LITGPGPASGQRLWRVAGQQTLDAAFQIPPSEFSESNVLARCRAFMDATTGYVLRRYFIVTDREDAIDKLGGPGITDIEFPDWLRDYRAENPAPPATAELIAVRDQAVVRFRFGDGEIRQVVIGSGNPLEIEFRGELVKVLEISPIPPGLVMRRPYPGGAHFFVQTSHAWTLTLAEEFSSFLRQRTGITTVAINIEDGWWFAGDPVYPIYNRFLPYMEPPTFEEFKRHTRFYCNDLSADCLQMGPARQ
jgi:hypothetical protein